MSTPQQTPNPAVALLYDNIAALPHEEYGVINFLPFTHDSEQVRTIKRHTCEAIVNLLAAHGHLKDVADEPEPLIRRDVQMRCRQCAATLVFTATDETGIASVDPAMFISGLASLNPACPHDPITQDDMRREMETRFWASTCRQCGGVQNDSAFALKDSGICDTCEQVRAQQ
jgi:hypothetical protein